VDPDARGRRWWRWVCLWVFGILSIALYKPEAAWREGGGWVIPALGGLAFGSGTGMLWGLLLHSKGMAWVVGLVVTVLVWVWAVYLFRGVEE